MVRLQKERNDKKGGMNTMKRKSLLYIIMALVMLVQLSVGIIASDEIVVDDLEVVIDIDEIFETEIETVIEDPELHPEAASGCDDDLENVPDDFKASTHGVGPNDTYTLNAGVKIGNGGGAGGMGTSWNYKIEWTFSGGKAVSWKHYTDHSSGHANPHTTGFYYKNGWWTPMSGSGCN